MKIVWEMYGNAYKSVCLKLCSGGGLRTIIVRNGTGWGACDYGAERKAVDGSAITVRNEGRRRCAITVRNERVGFPLSVMLLL